MLAVSFDAGYIYPTLVMCIMYFRESFLFKVFYQQQVAVVMGLNRILTCRYLEAKYRVILK